MNEPCKSADTYEDGSYICTVHGVRTDPKVHYHAGWNMSGYLPEMDPSYPFESFEDAKASLIDDMDRAGDHYFDVGDEESKTLADDLSAAMEDLNLDNGPEWGTQIGYMSYWVVQCHESVCIFAQEGF